MWERVRDYFLFNQPWRRVLLHISLRLPERWGDRLLEALYPDDLLLCFVEEER